MLQLVARARYRLGTERAVRAASRRLRASAATATTPAEALAVVESIRVGEIDIRPTQVRSEIVEFLDLVRNERPRNVLEVGTSNAGTLSLLTWASADDGRVLSLEIRDLDPRRRRLINAFGRKDQDVVVFQCDSHLEESRDRVSAFFGGDQLDLLFIDGDHSYEGAHRDYELYAPLVRRGGMVAFHDIVDGPPQSVGGVPELWRELRASFDDPRELIQSREQGGYGIGVGRVR